MRDQFGGLIKCKYKDCNKTYMSWYKYEKHLKNVHGEEKAKRW
jgi:hypothetical protein